MIFTANKRPRQTTAPADKSVEDVTQEKTPSKESGRGRENSVGSASSGGTNGSLSQSNSSVSGGGKPPKKKVKTVKKK